MKLQTKFKNSGIEWIGEIPEHWAVKRLKYSDDVIMGQSPESEDCNKTGIGIPFLQGNADFSQLSPIPSVWCEVANKIVDTDDILISVRAPVGAVNIADRKYGIGRGLCAVRPKTTNKKLIYYQSLCLSEPLNKIATGSTYTAVSVEQISNMYLPYPPKEEQKARADFLDNKIAQVDDLIVKKQRMIELLKEQRSAVINEAVTKGLNPDVKMKDSGVEWIGDVPEHWDRVRLKTIVGIRITDGPHETPDFVDNGVPFISAEGIYNEKINFESRRGNITIDEHRRFCEKSKPQRNDILFVKSGSTTGKIGIVETDEEFNIWSPLAIVRQKLGVSFWQFMFFFMLSDYFQKQVQLFWSFGTQPNIGMNVLENLWITKPPISEQIKIAKYLYNFTEKSNLAVEIEEKGIKLLNEYRMALISEVVTGKIKIGD